MRRTAAESHSTAMERASEPVTRGGGGAPGTAAPRVMFVAPDHSPLPSALCACTLHSTKGSELQRATSKWKGAASEPESVGGSRQQTAGGEAAARGATILRPQHRNVLPLLRQRPGLLEREAADRRSVCISIAPVDPERASLAARDDSWRADSPRDVGLRGPLELLARGAEAGGVPHLHRR